MVGKKNFAVGSCRILNNVYLALLGIYLFYLVQRMTMFNLIPLNDVESLPFLKGYLFFSFFVVTLRSALLLLSETQNRKRYVFLFVLAYGLSGIWGAVYLHSSDNPLYIFPVFFGVFSIGGIGLDYKKILKLFVVIAGSIVLSAALCALAGTIKNLVFWDNYRGIRSAWGIDYCTDMAAYYVFLCLAAWVAWDNVANYWFLLPAVVSLYISNVIAQSRASGYCIILFTAILVLNSVLNTGEHHQFISKSRKVLDYFCAAAFPVFAGLMIFLLWKYCRGAAAAIKLDGPLHGRLSLAASGYELYGIHLFGSDIRFVGFGRGVTAQAGYNYIDSSYFQLLLCYGVVPFSVLCVLWPLMTVGAARREDHRLCLALALIAVHSMIEQRFLALDYNIFMILPFSVLSSQETIKRSKASTAIPLLKKCSAALITASFIIGLFAVVHRQFFAFFRTLCSVLKMGASYNRRIILLLSCMAFFIFLSLCANAIYRIFLSALQRKRLAKKDWIIPTAGLLVTVLLLAGGEILFRNAANSYNTLLESERPAVEAVQNVEGLSLYVDDFPVLYNKKYGGISSHLFGGYDLARLSNIAVITDKEKESYAFLKKGFYSMPISDLHYIYTDSPELYEKLLKAYR